MSATEIRSHASTVKTFRAPHRGTRMHAGSPTLACVVLACRAAAFAQDEAKVKAGLDVWKTAGCAECHGAFADGEKAARRGADRRQSAPDAARRRRHRRDDPVRARGTGMPSFGEDAYTPRGCYGEPAGPCRTISIRRRAQLSSGGDRRRRDLSACARRRAARGDAGGMRLLLRRGRGCCSATIRTTRTNDSASRLRDGCCCPASSRR